ncbi:sodium- and chloride-dependent GABA transporter ine-like [Adelges cooleyi]|uniref:sodium- and chloride-dependent GABA transporter ine-like n=1 Tax=Adelges cooleyi TaxID=133065 RepID=UPI002180869D|nr:sodium- and chloride-dependent GABA transporter ine-like [Adelges cooleyi]
MSAAAESKIRNINNNVVETDRKWSPKVHTKIYIPPIRIVENEETVTGQAARGAAFDESVKLKEYSSGSESSEGRQPFRHGSYRLQPVMAPRALSPSLRSLKAPAVVTTMTGSVSLNSTCIPSDLSPLRPTPNNMSVRSLASIGMGSTDGRKLTITKVPTSPAELLNLANPQRYFEDEDGQLTECSSCTRSLAGSESTFRPRVINYWPGKLQFILACLGCSVGLGNLWRFPYHCYKSGGGIFLIPYYVIMIFCGVPLLYLELAVGQFTKRGPIGAISKLCPILKGAGLSSVVTSFFMSTYYNVIIAYVLYYFFSAFRDQPPWTHCNNRWNTPDCWSMADNRSTTSNSKSPTEEFYYLKVLHATKDLQTLGSMRWELVACMFVVWIVVYFTLWKSIKSSGRVLYLTATLPFALLIVLLVRSLYLDGAEIGLDYFLYKPQWRLLLDSKIWVSAVGQNLNSVGLAFGLVISFASYNRYNNNILVDTITISLINGVSSFAVGLLTFATLGHVAKEYGKSMEDVILDSPGIVFVLFPEVLSNMPFSGLWSTLLFFAMLCLCLNSEFAIVEVVVTSIQDGFPRGIKKYLVCHELLVLAVCLASFLLGLPFVTQGGIYLFEIVDYYIATWSIIYVAFFEVIAVSWMYGANRLSADIQRITGTKPLRFFTYSWYSTTPLILMSIWMFSLFDYEPPTYVNGTHSFPLWAHMVGWSVVMISLACIPVVSVYTFLRSEGMTFYQKLNKSIKPRSNDFGELPTASKDNLKEMATLIECKVPEIPPIVIVPADKDRKHNQTSTVNNTSIR